MTMFIAYTGRSHFRIVNEPPPEAQTAGEPINLERNVPQEFSDETGQWILKNLRDTTELTPEMYERHLARTVGPLGPNGMPPEEKNMDEDGEQLPPDPEHPTAPEPEPEPNPDPDEGEPPGEPNEPSEPPTGEPPEVPEEQPPPTGAPE